MSEARWCDYGDHAFAGGRPGTIVMARVDEAVKLANGQYSKQGEIKSREICPECAAVLGMNEEYVAPQSPSERHDALTQGDEYKAKHGKS